MSAKTWVAYEKKRINGRNKEKMETLAKPDVSLNLDECT